jgi:hypothetical protein
MARPAVSPAATYPDEIWDTLKAVTHFIPPTVISEGVRGRYQLLEVLVTRIMSLLQPEYTWTVTRVSKDHGMDFVGRRVLFEIPDLNLRSVEVVTGQCKRVRNIQSLGRALAYDVVRMVPGAQPSHIVLVVAGRASSALRKKTVEEFTAAFQRPVTYLGIEELDYFVRRYLRELQPLIEEALGGGAAAVIEHFSGPGSVTGPPLSADSRSPGIGETGKPFEITVQLHSGGVPLDDLRVRWEWGSGGGQDDAPALLRLVRPLQLARSEGMALSPGERLAACLRLKLVGYHPGRQALGTLVFTEASGAELHRQPLGEIELADQYHPPFFRAPFEPFFREFAGLWEQARSGHTHAIAVTGAGGAGKTRFCQELGFHAEQEGGRYVFSSHPNNLDDPYQIFGGLMRVLVAEPLSLDDPGTVVLRHLRARAPELAERIEPTLSLLYRDGRSPQAAFDRAPWCRRSVSSWWTRPGSSR